MLPAVHRLRRVDDFQRAVRSGQRAGTRLLVVHVLDRAEPGDPVPAQVGFVVSKGVGTAVVRSAVKRRLRHLVRERLSVLSQGRIYVIRANPAAATAGYAELAADLDRCMAKVKDGRR